MSKINLVINLIYSNLLDPPLKTVASKKQSLCSKVISGIVIATFTVLSGGLYAVHAYNFFVHKKAVHLQKDLERAIENQDYERVKELLRLYPVLKTQTDLIHGIRGFSVISLILPLVAEQGNLEMLKLLRENGAELNAFSRGQQTALERALAKDHQAIVYYLLGEGATIFDQTLFQYFSSRQADIDVMIALVERSPTISSEGKRWSLLALASLGHDKNPQKYKKLLQLLIQKGDRFAEDDHKLGIPKKAQAFIKREMKSIK